MALNRNIADNRVAVTRTALTAALEDHFPEGSIDTAKWNLSGAEGTWSIQDGTLKCVKAGNDWANNIILSATTNFTAVHIIARLKWTGQGRMVVFRSNKTAGSGYGVQLRSDGKFRLENWGVGSLSEVSYTFVSGTWYWVEIIATGNRIESRVWVDGQAAPSNWQIKYTDTSVLFSSGAVGFAMEDAASDPNAYFDDMIVNGRVPINYRYP